MFTKFTKLFYHFLIRPKRIERLKYFIENRLKIYKDGILVKKKIQWMVQKNQFRFSKEKPIVLISSCKNSLQKGNYKYNGGTKLHNLWAKVLRGQGFETYIVTYDGKYESWLIEHQPVISLAKVKEWKKQGKNLKFLTTWLDAKAFIDIADEIYYFDAELSWTLIFLKLFKKYLKKKKIRAVATHSRTQQAWYMAKFKQAPIFVREWSDKDYWVPKPERRKYGLVGYMQESPGSYAEIDEIQDICQKAGLGLRFIKIFGDEEEVLEKMQRCDFYLGLNQGKNILWGEGCPRSQQEAMHAGCVVLAYDVFGNNEYIIDEYTGFLAPFRRADILAQHLIRLMKNPQLKEEIRKNSTNFINKVFSSKDRWPLLRKFLELEEEKQFYVSNYSDLALLLKAPTYIADSEIRLLSQYASQAKGRLVEIGAAYGGSSALIIAAAPILTEVHSIDPFVKDSMGNFRASFRECKKNVKRALKILKMSEKFKNWHLHNEPSYKVAESWKEPIDFLFIDGDHKYEAVKRDFNDWFPFVRANGYILLHDSRRKPDALDGVCVRGWPGPTLLAEELKKHPDLELIDEVFSLTIWKKK